MSADADMVAGTIPALGDGVPYDLSADCSQYSPSLLTSMRRTDLALRGHPVRRTTCGQTGKAHAYPGRRFATVGSLAACDRSEDNSRLSSSQGCGMIDA